MANGILKTQQVYYNDDSYSGSAGSEGNKYVIEDIYDFLSAKTRFLHYEMVSDIDFNDHDTYRYGVNKTVFGSDDSEQGSYLYGNGHKIRNLIIKEGNSKVFNAIGVRDVTFENLIIMSRDSSPTLFFGSYTDCSVTNVHIGCYIFGSRTQTLFGTSGSYKTIFTDCSFNLRGVSLDGCSIEAGVSGRKMTRCHVHLDLSTSSSYVVKATQSLLDNCYITGTVSQTGGSCYVETDTAKTNPLILSGTLSNSYIAVKTTCSTEGFSGYYADTTSTAVSFIDKDIALFAEENPIDNLYYLTTDQATDAEYLVSIGFPVAPI